MHADDCKSSALRTCSDHVQQQPTSWGPPQWRLPSRISMATASRCQPGNHGRQHYFLLNTGIGMLNCRVEEGGCSVFGMRSQQQGGRRRRLLPQPRRRTLDVCALGHVVGRAIDCSGASLIRERRASTCFLMKQIGGSTCARHGQKFN
jgi:hypothetical protein